MTHSSSLAGHWRLVVEGSDCIPGLHVAEGAPFSAMITKGNFTEEYLHIRQAVSSKGDETFLTYWSAKGRYELDLLLVSTELIVFIDCTSALQ